MRQEKQLLLDDIKQQISGRDAFVIFSHLGLKANDATEFRTEIDELGGNVEMVPKRVLRKAALEAGVNLESHELPGQVGLVFAGSDSVGMAKAVFKFGKESNALTVLGGCFDDKLYDADQVKQLSQLPSMDEMRAQLLGLFQAPMAQTLSTMNALLTSVCYALENKVKAEDNAE